MHRPPVQRTASICLATLLALALLPCWPLEATAASVDVASSRPAWIHWIGWSTDSRFAAWRQGHSRQTNTPGKPVWLARAQPDGRLSAASRSHGPVRKALAQHGIRGRIWVWRDQITPVDVVLRTRGDVLLAVVVRGAPPVLAVLRKWKGEYEVVANRVVPGPVTSIDAQAFESTSGDLIAVIARSHTARTSAAWLFTLPLTGRPVLPGAVGLPAPASTSGQQAIATDPPGAPTATEKAR